LAGASPQHLAEVVTCGGRADRGSHVTENLAEAPNAGSACGPAAFAARAGRRSGRGRGPARGIREGTRDRRFGLADAPLGFPAWRRSVCVLEPAVGDGPGSGRGSRSGAVLLAPCESAARIQRWADQAEFVSGAICASRAARRRSSVWAMPSRRSVRRSRRPQTRSIMNHMGRLTGSMTS
jgi:hypothetical protein